MRAAMLNSTGLMAVGVLFVSTESARATLRKAIVKVFDRATLTKVLAEGRTSRRFDALVSDADFDTQVFELIDRAYNEGWLEEFLEAVLNEPVNTAFVTTVRPIVDKLRAGEQLAPEFPPQASHRLPARSGLDDFAEVLKKFRGLLVLVVGGVATLPFFADLLSFSPPWPRGIVVITALAGLVALLLVFQLYRSSPERVVNKVLTMSAAALAVTSIAYLFALSLFTYETRSTQERFAKGFICSAKALTVFRDECPWLGEDELALAEFEAERLWTKPSIAVVRVGLSWNYWSASFMLLAAYSGTFIAYQLQQSGRFGSSSRGKELGDAPYHRKTRLEG